LQRRDHQARLSLALSRAVKHWLDAAPVG
jgi:hypothetical protein